MDRCQRIDRPPDLWTVLTGKRILVAPLDWGLGHAARCVPLIEQLLARGARPVIGADNGPLALLGSEFPHVEQVCIPGKVIRYAKGADQRWSMARQFPQMVLSIRTERTRLERIRKELGIDVVISDQRFGLRSSEVPSVLITHQLFPITPVAQRAFRRLNLSYIAKFDRCWVMDGPTAPGLAGELAHAGPLPRNARFIGTQSRLTRPLQNGTSPYRIVAVISGPEPQRTMLDADLVKQLQRIDGEHLLVRGLPTGDGHERIANVQCVPHLSSDDLAHAMASAALVVSRSGYTTLMDLEALNRRALLVPTPGQPEQEYLADLHGTTGRHLVQQQHHLDLGAALRQHTATARAPHRPDRQLLERALDDLGDLLG